MNLFHWKAEGIDLLIMAETEEAARVSAIADIKAWRWQDPERMDALEAAVSGQPRFIAEPLHTITIDSRNP
jgi:hypothetical protein